MLTASDYRGVYAIIPTPANPGSERLDAVDTINVDESARMVNNLIEAGCTGLIALGTTGECATLLNDDYDLFVRTILDAAADRVPTFVGTSALGGQEVVRRTRLAADAGAQGILLGLPQWQVCTDQMAFKFYAGVAELFPKTTIMVYPNTRAFRYDFSDDFWAECARAIPQITSAKFPAAPKLASAQKAAGGKIYFMPHEMALPKYMDIAPETTTSCWATAASMGPEPVLAIMNAVLEGNLDRMREIDKDLSWANEPVVPLITNPDEFGSYNIQMEKLRINAAGYCDAGPIRPPYDVMPEKWAEASRECGRRWAEIRKKYL
ncbi:dihydrodipicolinate synthase family protein [Novosphingobium sp. KN65.2]|uniref:dihydrodipicolinate synthase family protein n=1 Tax=Novosphingobium sp. KN65.2 TaxID=1478134 RepID=UPI0005E892B3|nr:dihydrodipicolinate synthase family protein [Novosphingobium sp. KN65.2]CDO34095.1 putative Trans-O-hydroxybenzylidenepyruvate hydratase-aldolase [Novosphingobium sp. KN65.2]